MRSLLLTSQGTSQEIRVPAEKPSLRHRSTGWEIRKRLRSGPAGPRWHPFLISCCPRSVASGPEKLPPTKPQSRLPRSACAKNVDHEPPPPAADASVVELVRPEATPGTSGQAGQPEDCAGTRQAHQSGRHEDVLNEASS